MDAGFIHVVEIGQYFMTTLLQEVTNHHNQKEMESGKHENWTRIGNHDQLSVR